MGPALVAKAAKLVPKAKATTKITSKKVSQTKISKADQKKFFPNLSKRVVVPLAEEESGNLFGLDLEAFLKQARNSAKSGPVIPPKTKQASKSNNVIPTPKPKYIKKKIALTPQLKAKALQLTLADKKKLISAQISHLSRSKQMEYKRLKEILAKKEKEKVEKKKQQ